MNDELVSRIGSPYAPGSQQERDWRMEQIERNIERLQRTVEWLREVVRPEESVPF